MAEAVRIVEVGEAALLVVLGAAVDLELNRQVHRLAAGLERASEDHPGLGRPVPAYASVLLPYDPEALEPGAARSVVEQAVAALGAPPAPPGGTSSAEVPIHDIPVRYGGADGPDLEAVAVRVGRSPAEVVALHAGTVYTVFLLGFSAGFGYLGVLPPELELPRREVPRPRVPAGSVGIAGRQTGVYPTPSPGGWHLLGRTDSVLWDPRADPPALLAPGDRVRFVPA